MKITTEEFIKRSRISHGSKYDYSKAIYVDSKSKILIICPKHGEFLQLPHNHMKGCGCRACKDEGTSKRQLKTTEVFIKEANKVHDYTYTYEKTIYKKAHNKVIITCPKCGDFFQTADSHLRGCGCPNCWADKVKISRDMFQVRLLKKNKDKNLDYSLISFTDNYKATISCPKHGPFEISPDTYARTEQICPSCHKEKSLIDSWSSFCKRVTSIYGEKYVYPIQDYKTTGNIKVFCKEHGYFEIDPYNHLYGQECPICTDIVYLSKRREDYFARASKKHKNEYSYIEEDYFTKDSIIRIVCPKHGIFKMHAGYHAHGTKCPSCNVKSRGEHNIVNFLAEKDIDFSTEIRYNDCKDKRALPFDIGIKINNSIVALIEFDGVHHFKPNTSWDKDGTSFKTTIKHDKIKNEFCRKKNIPLLRIAYFDNDWENTLYTFIETLEIYAGDNRNARI